MSMFGKKKPTAAEVHNTFVGIAATVCALFIPICALVLIFAPQQSFVLIPIAIAFSLMGVMLGYFASKR